MNSILKDYIKLQYYSLNIIRKYTCMLITDDEEYKVYGTGIFIEIENNFFLVSAAHVFDNFDNLRIPLEKGKHLLKPGGIMLINNPITTRDKDSVDVGLLKLDSESVNEILTTYQFLQKNDLEINHQFQNQKFYTYLGYPSTISKFSQTRNSFHSIPFFHFTKPILEKDYLKFNRNPKINVITSYDKRLSYNLKNNNFSTGPNLYGISGCGLWFTDPMDIFSMRLKPKLVALMTDWPINDKTKVIGTRIDIITEVIRKNFDLNFPKSLFVQ